MITGVLIVIRMPQRRLDVNIFEKSCFCNEILLKTEEISLKLLQNFSGFICTQNKKYGENDESAAIVCQFTNNSGENLFR